MRTLLALALTLALAAPALADEATPVAFKRFALVIGANDGGAGREPLRYATSDARTFARVLEELGGVSGTDRVMLLDPSRAALMNALDQLKQRIAVQTAPGVSVELLLYYSGHSDDDGLLLGGDRVGYSELRHALDAIPADVRIAILDSCSSGEFTRRKGGARVAPFQVDSSSKVKGHAFLTSSSAQESAQESDRIGASFFTHYLTSGLRGAADVNGDGRVTLNEAYQFAFHETLQRTEATRSGPQHPAYEIQLTGTGDLVMTDLHSTSGGLKLARDLQGRLFVHDQNEHLVAELYKLPGRQMELALEPGTYRVTLDRDGKLFNASLAVAEGKPAELSDVQLASIPGELTASRGGSEVTASVAPAAPAKHLFLDVALLPQVSLNEVLGGPADNNLAITFGLGHAASIRGGTLGVAEWVDHDFRGIETNGVGSWIGGDMRGIQLTGVGTWVLGNARGVQAAGLGNAVDGSFQGLQMAGGLNASRGASGALFAGAVNLVRGDANGLLISGGFNAVDGHFSGSQFAGAANYAAVVDHGLQMGSSVNIAGELHGAQIGIVNVGGTVTGAQVGIVNVAGDVTGTQIGLVNVSRDMHGVPVGLFSWIQHGHFHGSLWYDRMPNAAFQVGTDHVYGILTVAGEPNHGRFDGVALAGLGVHIPFDPWFAEIDGSYGTAFETSDGKVGGMARMRLIVGHEFAEHFALFAGGIFNGYHAEDSFAPRWAPQDVKDHVADGRRGFDTWMDAVLGVRF